EEALLEALVETLIPATDTPGGRELLLHLFVLKMVGDCHGPEDQQAFSEGLGAFTGWARDVLGVPFVQAGKEDRQAVLGRIDDAGNSETRFFALVKMGAIRVSM